MCGIAGYAGALPRDEVAALLRRMCGAIAHRGPDAQGVHVSDGAGLGHRRLSVIDLTADGAQPMHSACGTFSIAYNGEIFNYIELRKMLEARGRRFRTASDTEVVLQLYEEYGPDFVTHLNGDFALAIWDERHKRMVLARDRMGVRPLFYTWHRGVFYFASEVKALLQVPGVEAEIDPFALDQIFTLWAPIAPRTPFKGIFELPPAHMMIVENGEARSRPYWALAFPEGGERDPRSEGGIAEELRTLLEDATRIRLRADVEVGSFLSGGLDSSIVSGLAARMAPNGLRTFSVTFDDAEFDESDYQQTMVRALGTQHHSIACGPEDIAGIFPAVVWHMERPVTRTAPAPLYQLSGLVREQGLKVVLSGEGADEIFAGYDLFREARIRRFCGRQPGSQIRPHLFRKIYPYLSSLQQQTPEYLAAFFGTGVDAADDPLFSHRPRIRATAGAKMFFSRDLRDQLAGYDATEEIASELPEAFVRWHPLHQAQYIETRFLLPGYILSSQGDRMAMAHGVETRFPFLDHRLVEFAAQIPPNLKLKGLREKHILRAATADLLPQAISERPKQPYRAPDSASFRGPVGDYVDEIMSAEAVTANGLFNPLAAAKLLEKCRRDVATGFRDNAAFVGIVSTQLWAREFSNMVSNRSREASV
ncbi:asparagine synthase (glutamine-hydrolyzing) [Mesorhizobium soli]|jgi:asparagine synthase (glutamine-hydrolysing)|uniref:asparagine synthase (glutamine-hydrolyzing) n=1 Tax=Pseudaminobacter soli (ex Li et al. 2025) TaxID=1295366 RepID=UPI0024738F8F|nr:asparagine synthase (glutamine-hydrolyzing) [Mesorhizobium soli]MDH6233978.1 asparagine synthase (glutamine-hydrolyzing) [Mesorhizobium soli]